MSDSAINQFVGSVADAAGRAAFTPTPPTPASGPSNGYTLYQRDTDVLYSWDSAAAAWVQVGGGGANTVTAAGTLTSGQPVLGGGSKAVVVGAINLAGGSSFVTGVLPVANGGTGVASALYVLRSASVQLTNAQIKALPTTPITLVAAPGAGFRVKPISVTLQLSATVAAYTNINATSCAVSISMTDNTGAWVTTPLINDSTTTPDLVDVTTVFGNIHTLCVDLIVPYANLSGDQWIPTPADNHSFSDLNNKALVIAADNNGSGDFGGGNAAQFLNVLVGYAIEAIP